MPGVIDADTHVIESDAIWEFFDKELIERKPRLVQYRDPGAEAPRNYWVIDGHFVPKPPGKGGQALATPPIDKAEREHRNWRVREMTDLQSRMEDADRGGVEVQVVYPTIFIAFLTDDAELEVALCRSYNRFQADAWSKCNGRLRWVVVPPLQNIEESIKEMRWGKDHGAVGVMFRGIEKDKSVAEPYFFPVYEEAQRLDMPVCIHTGPGCPTFTEIFDSRISFVLPQVRMLPLMAFHDLVANKIPEKFPDLRIGFIEANTSWIPFMGHWFNRRWKKGPGPTWMPQLFRDYRLYAACEADEDLEYILRYTGEDNMITGSDYGHTDPSAEPELVRLLRAREDVSPQVMDKILMDNPRRFYGL